MNDTNDKAQQAWDDLKAAIVKARTAPHSPIYTDGETAATQRHGVSVTVSKPVSASMGQKRFIHIGVPCANIVGWMKRQDCIDLAAILMANVEQIDADERPELP